MHALNSLSKTPLGIWGLAALMLATRAHSNHFGSPIALPDASLAVFFMAGLWFGGWRLFAGLMALATVIDVVAVSQLGVSDYCLSPAYAFLIPTYAALFYAGRLLAPRLSLQPTALLQLAASLCFASTLAFVISNGSFYLFSGRFAELTWLEYTARVARFYWPYLSSPLMYCALIIPAVQAYKALHAPAIPIRNSH